MPWSQAVIFKIFDWLENWDITLILVAPKKLVLGTVNVRDTDALAIVSPKGIDPISSPGSRKSPSIFQSIYTYPPLGKLNPSQSPKLIVIEYVCPWVKSANWEV